MSAHDKHDHATTHLGYAHGELKRETHWWGAFVIGLAGTILVTGIAPVMVTTLGASSIPVTVFITFSGWLLCLFLAGTAWATFAWSRRVATAGPPATAERRFRRRVAWLVIVTEYFLVFPPTAAILSFSATAMTIWGGLLTAAVLIFLVAIARSGQGGSRTVAGTSGSPAGDGTPDACWKWGLVYINPADPAILVEKRFGIGYTLNLGNRWSWVILAALLMPAVALVLLR